MPMRRNDVLHLDLVVAEVDGFARQRPATERIDSQAKKLGIERRKLHNEPAIAR